MQHYVSSFLKKISEDSITLMFSRKMLPIHEMIQLLALTFEIFYNNNILIFKEKDYVKKNM